LTFEHFYQYNLAMKDPEFIAEIDRYRREYIGGPTPTYFAKNLTEKVCTYVSVSMSVSVSVSVSVLSPQVHRWSHSHVICHEPH